MKSCGKLELLRACLSAVLLTVLGGCGYTFQGAGSVLPPDIQNVQIPIVENDSAEPGLGALVTEALRDRFERFGVLRVVEERSEADAVLKARVVDVKQESASVTSNTDTELQATTVIIIAGELRRVTGPVLWRNPSIKVSQQFGTSSEVVVTSSANFAGGNLDSADLEALDTREISRGQQQAAFDDLADQAARKIYEEAVMPDF